MIKLKDILVKYTTKKFMGSSPVQLCSTPDFYFPTARHVQREMIASVKINAAMKVRANMSSDKELQAKEYLARELHNHMYGELADKLAMIKHALYFGGDRDTAIQALDEVINDLAPSGESL